MNSLFADNGFEHLVIELQMFGCLAWCLMYFILFYDLDSNIQTRANRDFNLKHLFSKMEKNLQCYNALCGPQFMMCVFHTCFLSSSDK